MGFQAQGAPPLWVVIEDVHRSLPRLRGLRWLRRRQRRSPGSSTGAEVLTGLAGDVSPPAGLGAVVGRTGQGVGRSGGLSILPAYGPVGGRIANFLPQWEEVTQSKWVLNIVRRGYIIPFRDNHPPLSCHPPVWMANKDPVKREIMRLEVSSLLTKNAVEEVRNTSSPGFYSRLFVVPKKNGKLRPVLDLSSLNTHIVVEHFRMETTRSIRQGIKVDDWAVSIDLQDAYLHVPICQASRRYLRFVSEGKVYQFKVLPFGISTAPKVFTKLMLVVAAAARVRGVALFHYLDDWLLRHRSPERLLLDLNIVRGLMHRLGLIPNLEKSELTPAQDFCYVGMNFVTNRDLVRVPADRIKSILCLVFRILDRTCLTAKEFLSLLGVLGAAADLLVLGRLHMRPLQTYLLFLWRPQSRALDAVIPLTSFFKRHLRWWALKSRYTEGVPLTVVPPFRFLTTDASLQGWGAHLDPQGVMFSGLWSPVTKRQHINELELRAVWFSLQEALGFLKDCSVQVLSDNSTVVAYLNRQGAPGQWRCAC